MPVKTQSGKTRGCHPRSRSRHGDSARGRERLDVTGATTERREAVSLETRTLGAEGAEEPTGARTPVQTGICIRRSDRKVLPNV